MVNIDDYKNTGWGLSYDQFSNLESIIRSLDKNPLRILEFGSGVSTRFLVDMASEDDRIFITSFENDREYGYNGPPHERLDLKYRDLVECSDFDFKRMFDDWGYRPEWMVPMTAAPNTRQHNTFYDIKEGDLDGIYDIVILDGPNGNGRSLAFLALMGHVSRGTCILIDDVYDYDFIDRLNSVFTTKTLVSNIRKGKDKWTDGGSYVIVQI